MVNIFATLATFILLIVPQALAVTYTPSNFVVVSGFPSGAFAAFYTSGSLTFLGAPGTPASPSYNAWTVNQNAATMAGLGIINVTPLTHLAGFGYLSPSTGATVIRLFYQTTNGDIRSAYHSGINNTPTFVVDPTVIATVPIGSPFSAMQIGAGTSEVLMIHYTDVNGVLTQRFSSVDIGSWSAPLTVTTP